MPQDRLGTASGGGRDPLDLDGVGEPGEVRHPTHGGPGVADHQVVAVEPGVAGGDREEPQGGDVDGGHVGHVDDDVVVRTVEDRVDRGAHLPGAAHVEGTVQDQRVSFRADVHRVLLPASPDVACVTCVTP